MESCSAKLEMVCCSCNTTLVHVTPSIEGWSLWIFEHGILHIITVSFPCIMLSLDILYTAQQEVLQRETFMLWWSVYRHAARRILLHGDREGPLPAGHGSGVPVGEEVLHLERHLVLWHPGPPCGNPQQSAVSRHRASRALWEDRGRRKTQAPDLLQQWTVSALPVRMKLALWCVQLN